MNIDILSKISGRVLVVGVLILFGAISALAQTATLRNNGKIAFTSDRDGNLEIYVMDQDGTNHRRLTNNNLLDSHPAWSPDGRKIAFLGQRPSGGYAIFKIEADGTNRTEITPVNYQGSSFPYSLGWKISWSPDSRQLAFRDASNSIFLVEADGTERRFLVGGVGPSWSPDGSKILFLSQPFFSGSLMTIKPDGTDVRTLPPLPDFYNWYYDATWSPSGNRIATTVFDGANEVVFVTNADGTSVQETISQCAASIGCSRLNNVDWSPDGQTLVYYVLSSGEIHAFDLAARMSRQLTNTAGSNSHPSWQPLPLTSSPFDFDGDGRADVAVFRPSDRVWYLNRSQAGLSATQFGLSTDKISPADYDGDGRTDISIYRDGTWFWLKSSDNSIRAAQFGNTTDIPVPADYTGDGPAELAVYRNGTWWTLDLENNQTSTIQFGLPTDKPFVADYDGDGRADQAVYRNGEWHLNRSAQGYTVINFGLASDQPVVGDYDGDGKADPAVYRDGTWYLLQSTNSYAAFQFGLTGDVPTPADFDGDGKTDASVFRNGTWYLRQSTSGISIQQFGLANDKPVPSAYLP